MTPGSSWVLGACIGLGGLVLATLAGANVMSWHHVHRVPCKCPPAAEEYLLLGDQQPDARLLLLVDLAVFVAPRVLPDEALAEARREIDPFRDGLEALAEEIEHCPQGVLVDVHTGDEHIRVVKGWRSFEVTVDSEDVDVHVSVPARLAGRVLDVL